MTLRAIDGRVDLGITLLEEIGTVDRIDLGTLDVLDENNCPGGQAVGLPFTEILKKYHLTIGECVKLGLYVPPFRKKVDREAYREALNAQWRCALEARRRAGLTLLMAA